MSAGGRAPYHLCLCRLGTPAADVRRSVSQTAACRVVVGLIAAALRARRSFPTRVSLRRYILSCLMHDDPCLVCMHKEISLLDTTTIMAPATSPFR